MATSSIDWAEEPPDKGMKYIPIYSPKPGQVMRLVILSDMIAGVWTHWLDERTVPCRGRDKGCACARLDLARRWKGYVACYDPDVGRVVLAELTLGAYHQVVESLGNVDAGLRGKFLRLSRGGRSVRSQVMADTDVRIELPDGFVLPEAPHVREALKRIWGV